MTNLLLDVQRLGKSFGERKVVDTVSFSLKAGQTLGLLGPNGAGKSTTVNMICGLLTPDQGQVLLGGQLMSAGNNAAKQKIGLVPQEIALFDNLSARENLKLFGTLYGLSGTHLTARCDAVLELVNLSDHGKVIADESPSALFQRLPAQTALNIEFAHALSNEILSSLAQQTGVTKVHTLDSENSGKQLHIALSTPDFALPVLSWLSQSGCRPCGQLNSASAASHS